MMFEEAKMLQSSKLACRPLWRTVAMLGHEVLLYLLSPRSIPPYGAQASALCSTAMHQCIYGCQVLPG